MKIQLKNPIQKSQIKVLHPSQKKGESDGVFFNIGSTLSWKDFDKHLFVHIFSKEVLRSKVCWRQVFIHFLWYASIAPLALCYWTVNGGLWVHTFAVKLWFRSTIILFYSEAHSRFAVVGRTSKTMVLPEFYGIERGGHCPPRSGQS